MIDPNLQPGAMPQAEIFNPFGQAILSGQGLVQKLISGVSISFKPYKIVDKKITFNDNS